MASFDEVLDRLRKRRADIAKLLAEIDEAIELVPRIKALAEANLIDDAELLATKFLPNDAGASPDLKPKKSTLSPPAVADAARLVLMENGRPLKRGALVKAMMAKGYALPGTDKSKNLGTILWRHEAEFVNLPRLGYWPRDVILEGVYDPLSPPDGVLVQRVR